MVEILLGLLRADREGDWHLHLACVRRVIPWCFALNKINYARYLPVYYAQMTNLEETCPDLYHHFRRGYFSVQLKSGNPFARIPVDQTTEETVNKDTQTAGGTRGFSVKPGAVARYYLTSEHRADALRQLREMIHLNSKSSLHHHDLAGTRIQKDEADVGAMVDLLENDWVSPFGPNPSDLISISTGSVATPTQSSDILNALLEGEEAYQCFQNQRLQEGRCFYDPIKKMNLEMFGEAKKATLKGTHKEITLKADRRLFGTMVLVAKNRNLSMPEVFSHPLGPIPWSLANPDGTMKKTNKAALAQHLEKLVEPTETITEATATIIDAMDLIQKLHGENQTFQQLSDRIFEASLNAGRGSDRIDVVFDVYLDQSIKSAERVKRGSQEGVLFKSIRPGHKIKNWRRLLTCGQTKNMLNQFLAESWRTESKRERLGGRTMFVTCGEKCFQLTRDGSEEVTSLVSNHEEADTRLLLHAKHSASDHQAIIIMSDDTDVFVIALSLIKAIGSRIYIRRGTRSRIRMIDITKVAGALGDGVCSALPGLHAWTGCDSVSALAGQGKIKALKILQTDEAFREAFISLGESWNLTQDHFDRIKEFTCTLYSRKTKSEDVNALRYQLFCSKKGDVESGQLPPCEDTLKQHTLRANYQTAIWRRSLQGVLDCPKPSDGHGWTIAEDGELAIQWMTGVPAPEAVMNFISCSCTRHCRETDCSCILNGLRCTELCKLQSCVNMEQEDSDVEQDSDDSDDDSD